jgi:hypothetical protein
MEFGPHQINGANYRDPTRPSLLFLSLEEPRMTWAYLFSTFINLRDPQVAQTYGCAKLPKHTYDTTLDNRVATHENKMNVSVSDTGTQCGGAFTLPVGYEFAAGQNGRSSWLVSSSFPF